jgi:ACS family hexuronate transporter-like MFS transporter
MTNDQTKWPSFVVYGIAIIGSVYGGSIPLKLINKGMQVYKARMTAMLLIALCPLLVLFTQYFGNVAHFGTSAMYLAVSIICIGAAAHQAWSANLFTTVSDMFPKKAVGSVTGIGTMAGGIGGVLVQQLSGRLNDFYRFKGIAAGWIESQNQNLGTAVEKLKGMSLFNSSGNLIDLNKVALHDVSKDVVHKITDVIGQANYDQLLQIQNQQVQPQLSNAYIIMFIICALAYVTAWAIMKLLVPKHKPITDL